jgi:hypothetical protein
MMERKAFFIINICSVGVLVADHAAMGKMVCSSNRTSKTLHSAEFGVRRR